MLIPKLAFRNITSAGLRTWLNVFVLSIAFVAIIWVQGFIAGMSKQIMTDLIDTEYGGGQFWHQAYDPFDPLTVEDSHAPLSSALVDLVSTGKAASILITSGAIFPDGRVQTAMIKGIDPAQKVINLPTGVLKRENQHVIPALIGARMAKQANLKVGDYVTARWRDVHGTFDATDVQIAEIMNVNVASVDNGQIWVSIKDLRQMLQASPNEATLVVLNKDIESVPAADKTWIYRDQDFLLKEIVEMIKAKTAGSSILYVLLLGMALLAIFDTQVLAIFRRRKEMGTLMALGMPRGKIISLFTLEGALHGAMALIIGAVYGVPLLILSAKKGFGVPQAMSEMGVAVPTTLYPSYGVKLFIGTILLVMVTVTIVSFLPTRKIVKLKPTDALRGKLS
ncbi:MAG: ABC transporter permease [Deltaproteobacteria bacterium]|nr:ABC transporter permease [Deltaproteobacteria bacterium]MBW2052110.1 ABC transporter permease [Deltaproteobacteria bacterium]MBW2140953.1 ABC transporter permease [Deltaproteobacteria bacterium]MBW2324125.1 ABC transporter permease [Deltaproteobacteria bacterium]